jgi:outer membrane receptor protein involved in Fe transport
MSNKKFWLLLLVVPFLVATQVQAQGIPTGILNGRISETEGLPLPGVSVTAKSPALQGSRTAVTNVNGDYTVPNLPPGDYVVTFVMSGFQSVTRNVKVSSGQSIPLSAKLSISSVAAEATVVAQSESVSQTSQAATTYSADVMQKLPVARTILGSVVLTAGVNQNGPAGNITISGGQSFDNVFTVNGVNIQDNVRGTPTNLFIEDAIQETTTMTSGVTAEFGRFTGGVINAVTKQGGNSFSGSFRATLNNDANKAQTPIPTVYNDTVVPTYEATLGGPIWKDRIWFFGAGRYVEQETSGATTKIDPPNGSGTTVSIPQTNLNERVEGKLTITPFQSHTVTGSYTWTTTESANYYFPNLPILDLRQTYDRETPSDLLAFNYNGVITSNFFIEAQYSQKKFTFINSGGTDTSLIGGTAVSIPALGYAMMWSPVFCGVCSPESRDNEDILLKGTYFVSSPKLGSHSIAFGYQNFSQSRLSNNYQSGSNWWMYPTDVIQEGADLFPVIDADSYFAYNPIPNESQGSDLTTQSVFVNDTWRLSNKLSFNLGVRWDKNDATDSSGAVVADDSQFSPRLSVSYDLAGDGKFRVSASYARYVGQIQETIAGSGATPAGAPASYYYSWTGREFNTGATRTPTDQILREMFAGIGVTGLNQFPTNSDPYFVRLPGVNLKIVEPLSSPNADEFAVGFGGTLGSNFVYRFDAVRREYNDFYMTQRDLTTGFVSDDLGNRYNLGVFVNSNIPERNYTALNTSLAYRTGPLSVGGNWTWSHMIGTFVGEGAGGGPASSGLLNYPEYQRESWTAPRGSLSQDQRHRVRLYGNYDINLGPIAITPGLVQAIDTGTPYGAAGLVNPSAYVNLGCADAGADPAKCYLTEQTNSTYFFTSRDAYRTDTIYRTDLSLNLSARLGPVELYVQPQVINLFNGQGTTFANNATAINTSVFVGRSATANAQGLVRFDPFTATPIECPQGATAATCRSLGANWQKNTAFGKPTTGASASPSFQAPRTWLITMGVRF